MAKNNTPALAAFQHNAALKPGDAKRFNLDRVDPGSKPFSTGNKTRDKSAADALATELDRLQNMLWADRRFKLLVVLQGTDTSGKDGTIRGVFGQMSPLGVRTVGWKAPSEEERAHDYLWRIHAKLPGSGEVMIFNRSHYEDVLVPTVTGLITQQQTVQRYAQINDFERMLTENDTVICKFLLHISKDEQRQRLQDRLDDPDKQWKFEKGDLDVRLHWDAYQKAYSDAIAATGTPWAPWTIVPSDSKTHRNLMIASVMKQVFDGLKLRYPPIDPALKGVTVV